MPRTPIQSCGVDCLYVCARVSGGEAVTLKALERDLHLGPQGVSAEGLTQACRSNRVACMAVRLVPERLNWCSNPMVLHVNDTHFISFLGWDQGRLLLFDNQIGLFDCTPGWFTAHYRWDGAAIVVGMPSPPILLMLYGPQAGSIACGLAALLLLGRWLLWRRTAARPTPALAAPAPG
jgi:ABC-type bacteriocin/lantibiotic exporter with double-glycine peptidase domain